MTQFQLSLAQLRKMKGEIGTDRDGKQLRSKVKQLINDMRESSNKLKVSIDDYSNISVPKISQEQQIQKQEAYRKRFKDIGNKFTEMQRDVLLKMQQHLDLENQQIPEPVYSNDEHASLFKQQDEMALDREELKIQGQAAFMNEIIRER